MRSPRDLLASTRRARLRRACDRREICWRRPAAPGFAALAIAARFVGVDPPRPASPRLRSPRDLLASTRRARLRRACDRR
ncbi:hypothetical protein BST45_14635 [Mycobacterium shinjukuense]|nr:hypothetical protein BST45_14635 [Mycobacterium shinjukuense]